jgi:Polyketide cyclase / dehydrase and lipid transport
MKKLITLSALLIPFLGISQKTPLQFKHTEYTTASPASIWKIWTDVPNWKQWDDGLKEATLRGAWAVGAKGKLTPDKGPKAKFFIDSLDEGKSYTFKTRIPFGFLVITRTLTTENERTAFTHEVSFTGLLKKPFDRSLGKRYQGMLPVAMRKIKAIAEQ